MTRYFLGDEIAGWLEVPRHPVQDAMLAASWPAFVQGKELGHGFPGSAEMYYAFDEVLRQGTLYYLSDGEPNYIEIPNMYNPNHK